MGDPIETGAALDQIHRPKMAWPLLLGLVVFSLIGLLVQPVSFCPLSGKLQSSDSFKNRRLPAVSPLCYGHLFSGLYTDRSQSPFSLSWTLSDFIAASTHLADPHGQRSSNLSGSGWICHESGTSCRIICPVIRLDRVPLSQPVLSGHPEMRPLDGSCSFRHPAHAFQHVRVPVFMHLLCHLDLRRDAELVSGEKKQSFPAPWHTVFSAAAVRCLSVFHRFCFLSERTAPVLSVALSGKCISPTGFR